VNLPRVYPLVSIVIPTHNSEKTLKKCLEAIENEDYPRNKVETIIIDNLSDDKTVEIAKRFEVKIFQLKMGRSAARNYGAKKSKGKYVLFVDSDMYLSKDVVKESVDLLESNETLVGLYISEKIAGTGFWSKVRNFERDFYNGTCIDAVRFVRKNKFLHVNGFDEKLIGGEDWDLDRRLRETGSVDMIRAPLYHDEGKFDLEKYLKKKKYYSTTLEEYVRKWGNDDSIVNKQLSAWYRLFGVFVENGKWRKLARHPLLTLGMYYLRLRVGYVYLRLRNWQFL